MNRAFEAPLADRIACERLLFHSFAADKKSEGTATFLAKRKREFKNP
ncbi:MAG: hypothetical protein ABIQ33_04480 [Caldimonas sp.]